MSWCAFILPEERGEKIVWFQKSKFILLIYSQISIRLVQALTSVLILILGRRYASRSLRVTGFAHFRWSAPVTAATTPRLPSYLGLRHFQLGRAGLASGFSGRSCRSCTNTNSPFSCLAFSRKCCLLFGLEKHYGQSYRDRTKFE